jgi:acetyl esterase/lipase
MNRRRVIGLGIAGAFMNGVATAQTEPGYLTGDSTEFVKLWPRTPPGGEGVRLTLKVTDLVQPDGFHVRAVSQIQTPGFFVYRPAAPNGLGLLIIPGGGYSSEGADRGGREIAQYFSGQGFTCFVLRYRLPGEGWKARETVPLQDAQRAMRLIRRDAVKYAVDPARLSAIGFSAGGHLSSALAIRHGAKTYSVVDSADGLDAAPLVCGHMYPVVTMGDGAHSGSRDKLLGLAPSPGSVAEWSLEKHVAEDTVPSFICLAADDQTVAPFPNGVALYGALQAQKRPSELHVFETGGHGFSLHWTVGKPCAAWPGLFLAWASTRGFKA